MSHNLGGASRSVWSAATWINNRLRTTIVHAAYLQDWLLRGSDWDYRLFPPNDFNPFDWRNTSDVELGRRGPSSGVWYLRWIRDSRSLFFRPNLVITKTYVVKGERAGQKTKDVLRGVVINFGEPAEQVSVALLVEGLIDPSQNLCWPLVQPRYTPLGDCQRGTPKIGKNIRDEFDIADKVSGESWRFGVAGTPKELKTGTTYDCLLNLHEGTTGASSVWEFTLTIAEDGQPVSSKPKKAGRIRLSQLSAKLSAE